MIETTETGVFYEVAQKLLGDLPKKCPRCTQREGKIHVYQFGDAWDRGAWETCELCKGSGTAIEPICPHCNGDGMYHGPKGKPYQYYGDWWGKCAYCYNTGRHQGRRQGWTFGGDPFVTQ